MQTAVLGDEQFPLGWPKLCCGECIILCLEELFGEIRD